MVHQNDSLRKRLDDARQRANFGLSQISELKEQPPEQWERHALAPDELPLPDLVLFAFTQFLNLKESGPGEKVRWSVRAQYDSHPFIFSLEKFGARLYVAKGISSSERNELVKLLRKAAQLAELYLKDLAQVQIHAGKVTIENQFHRFDQMYQYFRERAQAAYVAPPPPPVVHKRDEAGNPIVTTSQPWRPQMEGGFLAQAMLDSYFSRLEHLLVLVLPFTAFDPSEGKLLDFVGDSWDDKWKLLFDMGVDAKAREVHEQLKDLKETVRNPTAHGGFQKRGTSFFFHVDGIGALPALLSKHQRSWEFSVTPIPQRTFRELCDQLDVCEQFLAESYLGPGIQYAAAGLDAIFSEDFRALCREAGKSKAALDQFIDQQTYIADQHANMDY